MKLVLILCIIFCVSFALIAGIIPFSCYAKTTFVTIGTGGITGIYYPTGGAIAKMVNKKRKDYGIRVTVESTGGSVFNVNAIMAGDLEFGVVQSDRQYQAMKGTADWKDKGKQKDLRAVFAIHPESLTLVASDASGIKTLKDCKGKRVNIGNPGSGTRQQSIDALKAVGLDYEKDMKAEGIKASESAGLLQDGRLDAFFYTVGHPNGSIKEACAGKTKVHFVPITGPGIDKLLKKSPYYAKSIVPIKMYPAATNKADTPTFGVKATFVTSAKVPDKVVYAITKEVFDNFEAFKKLHPAYVVLTKKNMLEGLSAPIHPGAARYYVENNLAQYPEFPWPPPPSSASNGIPTEFLRKPGVETLYLHDVEQKILDALNSAGYYEKSYFSVPDGFAMVTRLEQINYDGTSKEGRHRWQTKVVPLQKIELKLYIKALFKANKGLFRIIVFIFTPHPFSQTGLEVSQEQAIKWLSAGLNVLPSSIGNIEYSKKYNCHALIYEFEKLSPYKSAKLVVPGYLDGRIHLVKAKLWSYWEE
jgi:TRAP transporter TAXI family solute receptor